MPTADRRAFLRWSTAAAAAGWSGSSRTPARARSLRTSVAHVVDPAGTTLEATVVPYGTGYRRLREGPGFPIVVRDDLAPPHAGTRRPPATAGVDRASHRRPPRSTRRAPAGRLARPLRAAARSGVPAPRRCSALRSATAMVERIRALGAGPMTDGLSTAWSRPATTSTTSSTTSWRGSSPCSTAAALVPDSGVIGTYEGVQTRAAPTRTTGIPTRASPTITTARVPRLSRAPRRGAAPFDAPEHWRVPWYRCYGNHDGLIQATCRRSCRRRGAGSFDVDPHRVGVTSTNTAGATSPADLAAIGADPANCSTSCWRAARRSGSSTR